MSENIREEVSKVLSKLGEIERYKLDEIRRRLDGIDITLKNIESKVINLSTGK